MITSGTRFYRPALAKLTGKELMFARESLDKRYRRNTELDVPDFDFAAPYTSRPIMTRRVTLRHLGRPEDFDPRFFDMGPFQVTYNFSHAIRKNNFPVKHQLPFSTKSVKKYGASGWSFRMLYEFLCEVYNMGVPFVDTYFEHVFPSRPVYTKFLSLYEDIQDGINREQFDLFSTVPLKSDGTPDMRHTVSKRFADFSVWRAPIIRQGCKSLAGEIRHDIEICLSTGKLPLRGRHGTTISRKSERLRDTLGGMAHRNRLFYASGQLIRHLNIYIEIGGKSA